MYKLMKNVQNTSLCNPYPYDDWKDFWIKRSGRAWPYYCPVSGCFERAEVGAHVQIVGDPYKAIYIVPMCYRHNNDHDAVFYIDDSWLVRVK